MNPADIEYKRVYSRLLEWCFFLPAAGYRDGDTLFNDGVDGDYWSSTPNESSDDYAYGLYFDEGGLGVGWSNRRDGHSVRPVLD